MKKLKLTKIITISLAVTSLLALSTIGANATWQQDSNGWWNSEENSYSIGWKQIDGNWYYFDKHGYMKTGWIMCNDKWYYLYDNGIMAKDTTVNSYSLGSDGALIESTQNTTQTSAQATTNGNNRQRNQNDKHPINTQGVTQKWLDVPYASSSDAQKLDIYLPNTGNGPFPVIVAIHGGGFSGGDKNSGEVNCELTGVNRGYAVISINYRLSDESQFPSQIYDIKAAIRFIKANAGKYNLDPNKIAAWGDSAGANLAAMLGTSAGVSSLEDLSIGNANQSSNVNAVVDFYGPTNFLTMDSDFEAAGVTNHMKHSTADSSESIYMGAQVTTIPDKVKLADPTTYISANTCPFFIENGNKDTTVPPQQPADFADALKKAIGSDKVTYVELDGAGHGGPQFETTENLDKVFTFLDKYLK